MKPLKVVTFALVAVGLVFAFAGVVSSAFRLFFEGNWGNLASVIGLILSYFAVLFSATASEAAREARDSVLSRTLEEEITAGHKAVSELTTLVEIGQVQLAAIKCSDLLDIPNRLRIRWENSLNTSSKNNWLLARQQLDSIHTVLRKAGQSGLGTEDMENVHRACLGVRTIFAEEQALMRRSEDRGQNGR